MCNLQDTMCIVQYIIHIVCYPLTICISTMFNGSQPFWNEPTNYPYFAFWSASTNLLSGLKWSIDQILWSDPLIWYIQILCNKCDYCIAVHYGERTGGLTIFLYLFLYLLLYMYYIFERTDRGGIALEVHPSSREQRGPHFITDRTQPSAPRFVFLFSFFVFVFLICIYIWIDSCMCKCISNDQEPFK